MHNFTLLNNQNIYDYFPVASSENSEIIVGKQLFDFVNRQSKTLVVTIGDSWTWGADLTEQKLNGSHIKRLDDDDYRINNMYGNVLAKTIDADFLNLGELGSGNWHIVRKLKELGNICHKLQYDSVLVLICLTETGREFNSHCDVDVDYRSWLLNNIKRPSDYYQFLQFVNSIIAKHIYDTIKLFDKKYQFVISTNFVDPVGYELLSPWFISDSWLKIICKSNRLEYRPSNCYLVFPWVIDKFNAVFDMAPELDKLTWLSWANEIAESANVRANVCKSDGINFGSQLHPLAKNHHCWAKYLLGAI